MLLILAGVTIAALTGSDSAPSKANEAKQKNDIGTAKDDVSLAATNAITEAYETAYVETGVSAGEASTTVGTNVRTKLNQKYGTDGNFKIGLASITATLDGTITIWTTDFEITGEIAKKGGNLTWGEIGPNVPGIKLDISSIEIYENAEQVVNARFKQIPEGTITWTSNSEKATVTADSTDSKKATIKGITQTQENETVTITAQSGEYSASIEVGVLEKPIGLLKEQERGVILSTTKNTKLKDNKGNVIWIPADFKISTQNADNGDAGNNVEEGIIIEDANENQFVWVPIGDIIRSNGSTTTISLSRYQFASDGTATAKTGGQGITIDENVNYSATETTSNTVARKDSSGNIEFLEKSKVGAAGGYYIGRYEAGTGNVCKYNVSTYTGVTRDTAKTQAQGMYTSNPTLYKSDLLNSYAWDTAIYFIQQCGTASNHATYSRTIGKSTTGTKANTGKNLLKETNAVDVQCNIYDMAGNVWEWSTERTGTSNVRCVIRGGLYSSDSRVTAMRKDYTKTFSLDDVSRISHCTLYNVT